MIKGTKNQLHNINNAFFLHFFRKLKQTVQ